MNTRIIRYIIYELIDHVRYATQEEGSRREARVIGTSGNQSKDRNRWSAKCRVSSYDHI